MYNTVHIGIEFTELSKARTVEFDFSLGDFIKLPHVTSLPLIIAIDPGKTHMVATIGTCNGTPLYQIGFSGGGSKIATTDYCVTVLDFLRRYLAPCNIRYFCQERVILPKNSYKSMVVLNEIRVYLNKFCTEELHLTPDEVNNVSWKAAILPPELRKKTIAKGSQQFIRSMYPNLVGLSHDHTDSLCIYLYKVKLLANLAPELCDRTEELYGDFVLCDKPPAGPTVLEFPFNPNFSVKANAAFYGNRFYKTGFCRVSRPLTLDELYKSNCKLDYNSQSIYIVVLPGGSYVQT